MSNHLLRLHVERPGTPLRTEQGSDENSLTGHTWFEVPSPGGRICPGVFQFTESSNAQ